MNCFCWSRKGAVLTALIVTTLFVACPVRAQNPKAPKTPTDFSPDQGQKELSVLIQGDGGVVPNWTNELLAVGLHDSVDEMLGATLQPVGDTLRAQLDISAGRGLVVETLRAEGQSAQAGLKLNDVLLSLADKPLATADDLTKQLKAAGESAVPLKILRAGKPLTIQVRPIYRVTLGPVADQKTEYHIGISVVGPNDAVRAQLSLPDTQGMVVSEVESGSPAEKAGVHKYDIVLQLNGKPIDSGETLRRQVQAARDQPAYLKILRAAKPMSLSVTATTRKVETNPNLEATVRLYLNRSVPVETRLDYSTPIDAKVVRWRNALAVPAETDDLRQRLDHVEKELNAVRAALDKINETLKSDKGTKRNP